MPNSHVSRTAPEPQQESFWTGPAGTLGELIAAAEERVRLLLPHRDELEREAAQALEPPAFADALRGGPVAVIAEVKRRSPSRGDLNPALHAGERATAYVRGGAAAVSVLTEPTRFRGAGEDLRDVAGAVRVPVLRKDFIVHELQVVESRALGASAVLLIARALAPRTLTELARAARAHRIEPLVEVRTPDELHRAVDCGARVIGVNARDLETLAIDSAVPLALLPQVPRDCIAVAESGVRGRADAEALARVGADAILVGSALSLASDAEHAVRALTGIAREGRA